MRKTGSGERSYPPIGDYALIGDCRCAALVSRAGSIDWLCWPRFDSPAIFAALLDQQRGGRFQIRPADAFQVTRRYLPDTNILETAFVTATGACVVRDLMTVASEDEKRRMLLPEREVLREIEGIDGEVRLEIVYEPRPEYGRKRARLRWRGKLGIWSDLGSEVVVLQSDAPLQIAPHRGSASGTTTIRAGEQLHLSLAYSHDGPAVVPPLGESARERIERCVRWWRNWVDRCTFDGPWRDVVVRSALALKLLTYAPSGAIIAAPTTSLPERIGGDKNWDYRYCWLRDASFTLRALHRLGYEAEADAFQNWVLHATRLTWPKLQVLYDVYGRNRMPEYMLRHLEGYAGSRPVRIGNDAHGQLQLDIYGEVADAALQFAERGGQFDRDTVKLLRGIGETIMRGWREPDEGIWEERDDPRHFTHSKVLCWIALDRLITLHDHYGVDIPVDPLVAERGALRAEIEARGYNERIGSYTRTFNGADVDASLLTLPLYGYVDATHLRMRSTYNVVHKQLAAANDDPSANSEHVLLYRYLPDNGAPDEGAFGICSFWAVECQAKSGDLAGAIERFERLLGYANDVGLYGEEIDPETGEALGNFPQGFTHIGLINAAITIHELHGRRARVGARERAGRAGMEARR